MLILILSIFLQVAVDGIVNEERQFEGEVHLGNFGTYMRSISAFSPSAFQTGALYGHHFQKVEDCLIEMKKETSDVGEAHEYIVFFEYKGNSLSFDFHPAEFLDSRTDFAAFSCVFRGGFASTPIVHVME